MTKQYTTDWFNDNRRPHIWKEVFSHLAGRIGLRILEVGCYEGRSAVWFLENLLTHPTTGLLVCVDEWAGGFNAEHNQDRMNAVEARFDKNVMGGGYTTSVIQKIKNDSVYGLSTLLSRGVKFDIVYVDACHRPAAATADIVLAKRLLCPGGYMVIDDYASKHPNHRGLTEAVDLWLVENPDMCVVHRGYQLIVKSPRVPSPVFYCQVYNEKPQDLLWCLSNLREHYPNASVYIMGDGVGVELFKQYDTMAHIRNCKLIKGKRLKLLEHGGLMLQRNLRVFLEQGEDFGSHLVKFDCDTWFQRPFKSWPENMGVYGTVQYNKAVADQQYGPRLRSLQGGCIVYTRAAVSRLLASKVLTYPKWSNPAKWGGDHGPTGEYVKRTGLISEDWVLGQSCLEAMVPMYQWDEIYSLWVGEIDNTALRWAVTHPHKNCPIRAKEPV